MRHLLLAVCLLATAGCSARGSPTVTQVRTKTVSVYVSTARASARQRAPEPSTVPVPIDDRTAPLSQIVPTDARIQAVVSPRAPTPAVLVVWQRSFGQERPYVETAVALWNRPVIDEIATWRRVFSLHATESEGVERMDVDTADLTGDGRDDFLVFEDMDGSGGCGLYRVYRAAAASATEIWRRHACTDWKSTFLQGHVLVTEDGVGQTAASKGQIHCCPRLIRRTEYRWNGSRLTRLRSVMRPARG